MKEYQIMQYITLMGAALSGAVSAGIIYRILITIFNNIGDENAVIDGSVSKKVKRLLKALGVMLCMTTLTTYLYTNYFS